MRSAALLWAALPALVFAHAEGDVHIGMPKVIGGSKFMAKLKSRNVFSGSFGAYGGAFDAHAHAAGPRVEVRATETCGPGVGNCDAGYCCSQSG
jgi:hypothetical protein